MVAFQLW